MTLRCLARFGMEGLLRAVLDTIASLARIASGHKPRGRRLLTTRSPPSATLRRCAGLGCTPLGAAGLRRGHEIYDPLLLGPA
jgi:hypothetical protein